MKKITFIIALLWSAVCFGQTMTDIKESVLKSITNDACACIDSISVSEQKTDTLMEKISKCINKSVIIYQMSDKMAAIDTAAHQEQNITINVNPESAEYRAYYKKIETELLGSCPSLKHLMSLSISDYVGEMSYTSNPQARFEYNEGVTLMRAGDFQKASKRFENAVKLDDKYAFAWDNLGLCYRNLGKYDKAIAAYKKSLAIDPDGEMPLVNLPVAYSMNGQNDKALEIYMLLQKNYPTNVEGFYGAGRTLAIMGKYEEALNQMCMAYILYTKQKSPYRADAETMIGTIYQEMKKQGKTAQFYDILKKNGINMNE